jgi:hypothetical protein
MNKVPQGGNNRPNAEVSEVYGIKATSGLPQTLEILGKELHKGHPAHTQNAPNPRIPCKNTALKKQGGWQGGKGHKATTHSDTANATTTVCVFRCFSR